MDFEITYTPTISQIKQMLELDNEVFQSCDKVSLSEILQWYAKNKDIYTVLLFDKKVVGYINFCPLKPQVMQDFIDDKIHDVDLTPSDIEVFEKDKTYDCLFMSIVIKKEFRGGEAVAKLSQALDEKIKYLKSLNITINKILMDCVSESGNRYAKRNGYTFLKQTSRNTNLYQFQCLDDKPTF